METNSTLAGEKRIKKSNCIVLTLKKNRHKTFFLLSLILKSLSCTILDHDWNFVLFLVFKFNRYVVFFICKSFWIKTSAKWMNAIVSFISNKCKEKKSLFVYTFQEYSVNYFMNASFKHDLYIKCLPKSHCHFISLFFFLLLFIMDY